MLYIVYFSILTYIIIIKSKSLLTHHGSHFLINNIIRVFKYLSNGAF